MLLYSSTHTWKQVIGFAEMDRVYKKPRRRQFYLDKTNTWIEFEATMYRHWWVGDPMTLRIHAFFRTIRQATTSSNVIRRGNRINYIDAVDFNNWKIHVKGQWEPTAFNCDI